MLTSMRFGNTGFYLCIWSNLEQLYKINKVNNENNWQNDVKFKAAIKQCKHCDKCNAELNLPLPQQNSDMIKSVNNSIIHMRTILQRLS